MNISFHTLGCRLNFSETGSIVDTLIKKGYRPVEFGRPSDVTLINTCTVTDAADATCRAAIRKARRVSPKAKIVVVGCYAQRNGETLSKMPEVDMVLGTSEKYNIHHYLDGGIDSKTSPSVHLQQSGHFHAAQTGQSSGRTRAFLKIQDGCSYKCSFCIIPGVRGASRWATVEESVRECKNLVARGFKEIVLTGVNIGEYGRGSGKNLASLVKALLAVRGLKRLRLSSVEPNTITKELLNILQSSPKFMPHFHLPLQSGSDAVLRGMKRRYRVGRYEEIIGHIKERFPHATLGADMICGFPGESEKQFFETYQLAEKIPLTHFHVFPYSPRKETWAFGMEGQVDGEIKRSRVKRLMALGEEKLRDFTKKQISQTMEVLFEKQDRQGQWWGYTPHYLKIAVSNRDNLQNRILSVHLQVMKGNHLRGILPKDSSNGEASQKSVTL